MEFDASKVKAKARAAAQSALLSAVQKVAAKSLKVVPRKTGKLAGSVYIKTSGGDSLSAEVGYAADYAAAVHSKIDYLGGIFEATKNECMQIIKREVEEATK